MELSRHAVDLSMNLQTRPVLALSASVSFPASALLDFFSSLFSSDAGPLELLLALWLLLKKTQRITNSSQ